MKSHRIMLAVSTVYALSIFPAHAQDQDIPNEVTLKCADNEKVLIHFGRDDETEGVYLQLPDVEKEKIPLRNYIVAKNGGAVRFDFVKTFADYRAVVRTMFYSGGDYFKADNKTRERMDCKILRADY